MRARVWCGFVSQLAEFLQLSGIIATLFCGMCCGQFARYNLTPEGLEGMERFYSKIVVMCDLQVVRVRSHRPTLAARAMWSRAANDLVARREREKE